MMPGQKRFAILITLITLGALACARVPAARAFIIFPNVEHWLNTASGTRTGNGQPITLTWSIVPDGTPVVDASFGNLGSSDLISFLDDTFGTDPSSSDPEDQPWFHFFTDVFGRWESLSGATYLYEPNDDGSTAASSSPPGVLGTRGDIRIAGTNIDDAGSTLAFNNFPQDGGDMVLDTSEAALFGNPANEYRYFRDVMMHEHGHGLGIRHVNSTTDALLMEPVIDTSFDGPQLDEVRAIQYYYGDANEKANGGLGNGTAALATDLGLIAPDAPIAVGADADVPTQAIDPTATDFVSIANSDDTDYFSFSVAQASELTAVLTPRGGVFTQAPPASEGGGTPTSFNASARSDLSLAVYDTDGTTLLTEEIVNETGLGGIETIADLELSVAGQYYAHVIGGSQDTIQLYELELSITSLPTFLAADFDTDGDVDDADLAIWELAYGSTDLGDADGDGDSDGNDFLTWQRQFGLGVSPLAAVPEPSCLALIAVTLGVLSRRRQWRRALTLGAPES